jgi:diaminopimelate decarboxylase
VVPSPVHVILSGCHAGPNPSPGLGTARSLRHAYPDARLIARDFSAGATGLHDDVFDEVWLCPAWEDSDLELAWRQLERRLDGAWFIPGLDVEIAWLAGREHSRILAPRATALAGAAKPAFSAAASLPFRIPEWVSLDANRRELDRFCRRYGWKVWLKGPIHESRAVRGWRDLDRAAAELGETWGEDGLFLQAHAEGEEVSLAFAAFEGELIDAVFLEKASVTPEGKVWSGTVTADPEELADEVGSVLRDLRWTGGGELEFVRDAQGELWLFDWNPRFPGWIHGAMLAGKNLPARLIERATGCPARAVEHRASGFVRIVTEIPRRLAFPPAPTRRSFAEISGKHPSGMPRLSRKLRGGESGRSMVSTPGLPDAMCHDLLDAAARVHSTPARVLLTRTAEARFERAAGLVRRLPDLEVAYSVKTNPDAALMDLARQRGLLAETISDAEVEWALRCGWPRDRIVRNGPAPAGRRDSKLRAAFADDLKTLASYFARPPAEIVGVRLRPPFVSSRFGVPVEEPEDFAELVHVLQSAPDHQPLGVSLHLSASDVGIERWEQDVTSIFDFAATLEDLTGRSFEVVDLGGGWTADQFDGEIERALERIMGFARTKLSGQLRFVIEPGKALAEGSMAVLTRVVDMRHDRDGRRTAILDAGIADVPLVRDFPHRLAVVRDEVVAVGRGSNILLGPSCMEQDCLSDQIALPSDIVVGDLVAVCDVGAYDASMSYLFGRGGGE